MPRRRPRRSKLGTDGHLRPGVEQTIEVREGVNPRAHERSHSVKRMVYSIGETDLSGHTSVPLFPDPMRFVAARFSLTTATTNTPCIVDIEVDGVSLTQGNGMTIPEGDRHTPRVLFSQATATAPGSEVVVIVTQAGDGEGPATFYIWYED